MNRISTIIKREAEMVLLLSSKSCEDTACPLPENRAARHHLGSIEQPLSDTSHAGALILDFSASIIVRNVPLWFIN
jgi:hypothetical protein